jgi:uncharacterized protein (TIGR03435 family)
MKLFALCFVCNLAACAAIAQNSSDTTPIAFEVASIRPHQGPLHVMMGFSSSGPRLTLEGYNRMQLILEAYDLKSYQVSWGSEAKREDDVYYDITAKAEGDVAPSKSEFRQMLRTLLAQRFNLKLHPESKEMPVYLLTVGRNGPKFRKSAPDAPERGLVNVHGRNQIMTIQRESMMSLAGDISNAFAVDRPLVDKTGLADTYDIKLEATPEFRIEHNPQPEDISVFTAVQEQLGLKLEPARANIQILVVDHIDSPSDN